MSGNSCDRLAMWRERADLLLLPGIHKLVILLNIFLLLLLIVITYIPIDEEDEDSDTDSDDSSSYRDSNKPSPAAMTVIVHVRDFVLQTWGPDRHFVHISVRENYYVMRPAEKNMPRCCDANNRLMAPVFVLAPGIARNKLGFVA